MTKPTNERIRQREAEERERHHAGIATYPACGAQMRRRLDGTWWHGKGACVEVGGGSFGDVPKDTMVKGKPAQWNAAIQERWRRMCAALRWEKGQWVSHANYWPPHRGRNEYDRARPDEGFTYTLQPGFHVCQWRAPATPEQASCASCQRDEHAGCTTMNELGTTECECPCRSGAGA